MISEGSRDTDAWSNDAENSALLHKNTFYFKSISKIRDAPKLKFFADAEQNETLGRRPNTEHGYLWQF